LIDYLIYLILIVIVSTCTTQRSYFPTN